MKSNYINDIIEDKRLTLQPSTLVKFFTLFDKIILKCKFEDEYLKDYVDSDHCKICDNLKEKTKKLMAMCKKHYAIAFYNSPSTVISYLSHRGEKFEFFGRYVLRKCPDRNFIFYIHPYNISKEDFKVYVVPKEVFKEKPMKYRWTEFKKPNVINFEIENKEYRLDYTNKYNIRVVELF